MPYDEKLAQRVRQELGDLPGLVEKKMFGGIAFLYQGNMACGVHKDALMVRINPKDSDEALSKPHVRVMDLTGKPMAGWVLVEPQGLEAEQELAGWVQQGVAYAATLPPK